MFTQPINSLYKVGPALEKRLSKLGLKNTLDLIFYYPYRYEDFSKITKIKELQPDQQTTIQGKINIINNRRSWKKRMTITEAMISDNSETIKIIWFNQPFISKTLSAGDQVYISGKVSTDNFGMHFKNPIYEKFKTKTTHTARIVPLYHLTAGLTQKQIRFFISQVTNITNKIPDWLPKKIIKQYKLLSLPTALEQVHFPNSWASLKAAKRRLGFDELFIVQLYNLLAKEDLKSKNAPKIKFNEPQIKNLVKNLPFTLTDAQKKSAWQIIKDLGSSKPMNRLLEGDVGCGKTVVAAIAMYNTALAGYQSVLMAPTEILAEQHYQTLEKILGEKSVSLITKSKKNTINNQKIIVGTHALIQKNIKFKNLGLAIIDEQHRFGVAQRQALQQKSGNPKTIPHLLSMTATPIPRTLALTVYGDLDLSIINQMPKDRKVIITKLVSETKRKEAYKFIKNKIHLGQQVFVVCPLIEESDKLGVKSVDQELKKLQKYIFPDLKIAKLHGKLKPADKEKKMQDFKNKKFDILVTTSVIEVGVDIPNATIIMIEGSDRFGLAQLHQFRGRVGRSNQQSYCLLFTDSNSPKTIARLNALVHSNDGFKLAEHDLKTRGPGDTYGKEQSGFLQTLKMANITDHQLIIETKQATQNIAKDIKKYPLINKKIEQFSQTIHLE